MRRRPQRPTEAAAPTPDWRSYDSVADVYARVRAPLHAPAARDLVEMMDLPEGGRVLDVGTGTGVAALEAAKVVGPDGLVAGVDPSIEMLRLARDNGLERLAAAEAIDLPFGDGLFHGVTATFVIFFFRKYETGLFNLHRILRHGGVLGVTTWGPGEDEFRRTYREVAEGFVGKELLRDAQRQASPWVERFSDPGFLKEILRDAGFRRVEIEEREYRFTVSIEDYIAGRETGATGRFLRGMLGETLWQRFHDRIHDEFRARFQDPIGDTEDVLLAVAHKPSI